MLLFTAFKDSKLTDILTFLHVQTCLHRNTERRRQCVIEITLWTVFTARPLRLWDMGHNTSLTGQTDKVDAFDNTCLCRILRIPYTDHVTNATVRLRAGSAPQLSQLIQARRLRFFGHVARMDTSLDITRALKVSIRGLPKDWRRPPGGPRHTWLRTLEADLPPLGS